VKAVLLITLVAVLGCSKRERKPAAEQARSLSISRRDFPGFSIELPEGKRKTNELDYTAGRIALGLHDGSGWIHLRWSFGPDLPDEPGLHDLARNISSGMQLNPADVHVVKDGVPSTFAFDKAQRDLITYYRCGARNVMLITNGLGEPTHTRLGRTFDCRPDLALERADLPLPIQIELPNFVATERTPGMLVLDDGHTLVRLRRQPSTPLTNEQMDRAFPGLLASSGFEQIKTSRSGDTATYTALAEGAPRAGFMRYVKCSDVEVQVFVDTEPTLVADVLARVQSARCLKAGEAPPQWPDAPPEAAGAGSGSN